MSNTKFSLIAFFALIVLCLAIFASAILGMPNATALAATTSSFLSNETYNTTPAAGTNTALCKFMYSDSTPLANREVVINGKAYMTDADGNITTEYLPYGSYSPSISADKSDSSGNGENYNVTVLNQKINVSMLSHIPTLSYLNNIYLYRQFVLSICAVDSSNLPVSNMAVSIYKNNSLVLRSTVTTCKAGTINFNWQEMPGGSNSVPLSIGDTLEIRAYDNDNANKYQVISQTIKLNKPLTYLQLVAYKPGEQKMTYEPKPYQVLTYNIGTSKAAALVFDYPIVIAGKGNIDEPIDKELLELTDVSGNAIDILSAKVRYNQIIVTYDEQYTASKISYVGGDSAQGYLVSFANSDVRVASTEQNIDFNSDENDYLVRFENEVFRLVNELRVDVGINMLSSDPDLTNMARIKSNDMKFNGYISHQSPGFDFYYQQLKQFGLSYAISGENLALVPVSDGDAQLSPEQLAAAVFWGWKQSPGHYANMVNSEFTRLGVGYAKDGYWTQMFGTKSGETVYKLSAKAQSYGGVVKVESSGLMGSDAVAYATPNEGMKFAGWFNYDTGVELSKDSTYAFTVQGDISLIAKFEKAKYNYQIKKVYIIKDAQGNYTVDTKVGDCEVTGGGNYSYGQRITFQAAPTTGYKFRGWNFHSYTPGEHPNKASAQMTVVAGENAIVYAVFERISEVRVKVRLGDSKYQVVLDESLYGKDPDRIDKLLSEEGYTFNKDNFLAFILGIKSYDKLNYKFLYWQDVETKLIYDMQIGNSLDNRFILLNSMDINIVPVFEDRAYTVQSRNSVGGVVIGIGSYITGSDFTITASPNAGYEFDKWTDDGVSAEQSTNPVRKFSGIASNVTVSAQFKKVLINYTLTTESNMLEGGVVVGGGAYSASTHAVLTASVKDNTYEFSHWEEDGKILSFNNMYIVKMNQDRTIMAKFNKVQPKYRVNVISEHGSVSMSTVSGDNNPSGLYYYGDEVILTAQANAEYVFIGWYSGGKEISSASEVRVRASNQTIIARYAKEETNTVFFQDIDGKVLSIQSVANGGAAIAPTNVERDGYEFIGWNVTDEVLSNITSSITVTAQYIRQQLSAPEVTGGKVLQAKDVWYYGDHITVKANPAQANCKFSHWEDSNGKIVSYNSELKYILFGNTKLIAVYINSTIDVDDSAFVAIIGAKNLDNGRYSFNARVELSGAKLIECGIIFYDGMEELTLRTEGTTICVSNAQSSTGQFIIAKGNLNSTSKARAYLMYSDSDGNIYTVYSEVVSAS